MKFHFLSLLILCVIFFPSCNTDSSGNIEKLEQAVADSSSPASMQKLIDAYVSSSQSASEDANTKAGNLSKAADLYMKMNKFPEAAGLLTKSLKEFGGSNSRTENILKLASIYRTKLASSDPSGENFVSFMGAIGDEATFKTESSSLLQGLIDRLVDPTSKRINKDVANDYINMCEMYAGVIPSDEQSAEYLIKAGEMARNTNQFSRALTIYDWVMDKFPDSDRAPQALFFKGFTLDDSMNNKDEAKKYYEEFLTKYPKDEFADDTQFLLDNLGKSDDEIIQAFENKRKK